LTVNIPKAVSLKSVDKESDPIVQAMGPLFPTMTSSDLRVGAWDYFRFEHIMPLKRVGPS